MVAAVEIGDDDPVVVSSGTTAADRPSPEAPFYIASITKTFVAAIVLRLVERGSVDLDEPASHYVELWPAADRITVRELLGHRSGLPAAAGIDAQDEWASRIFAAPTHLWTPREVLTYIAEEPLLFDPGTQYHYSNTDFIVAGLVAEAVTGQPFAEQLRSELTVPLGLGDTVLDDGTGPIDPRIPHATYTVNGEDVDLLALARPSIVTVWGTAAAMVSSPADLVRWAHALYGTDEVLSPASRREMFDPDEPSGALGTQALCPCSASGRPSGRGHDGLGPGFDSLLGYFADSDVSIVVYVGHSPAPSGLLQEAMEGILHLVRTS